MTTDSTSEDTGGGVISQDMTYRRLTLPAYAQGFGVGLALAFVVDQLIGINWGFALAFAALVVLGSFIFEHRNKARMAAPGGGSDG